MKQLDAITHNGHNYWTVSKVAHHLGIDKATFTSYVSKGVAPAPTFSLERTRLWDAQQIQDWHANRPGSPVRNAPTPKH